MKVVLLAVLVLLAGCTVKNPVATTAPPQPSSSSGVRVPSCTPSGPDPASCSLDGNVSLYLRGGLSSDPFGGAVPRGAGLHGTFRVTNLGNATTFRVYCGSVEPPWSFMVDDENGSSHVPHAFPQGTCDMVDFNAGRWPANATVEVNFSWDGRLYNGENGYDAPPGSYALNVTFACARGEMARLFHFRITA
ncbi:MAG: hypothetical protein ACYDCK_00770 [Thermoplasmatota archaeon]